MGEAELIDQPLVTVMIQRPWHWGIVVVSDPSLSGQTPDMQPDRAVSANENGIIVMVRHAQDGVTSFDPGFWWAESTITVRQLNARLSVPDDQQVVFDDVLLTPSACLTIGDADDVVVVPAYEDSTRVQVRSELESEATPGRIWVDLSPGDS